MHGFKREERGSRHLRIEMGHPSTRIEGKLIQKGYRSRADMAVRGGACIVVAQEGYGFWGDIKIAP